MFGGWFGAAALHGLIVWRLRDAGAVSIMFTVFLLHWKVPFLISANSIVQSMNIRRLGGWGLT